MGAAIEKFAFMPPDPAYAKRTLPGRPEHRIIKHRDNGTDISVLYFQKTSGFYDSGSSGGSPTSKNHRFTIIVSHGNAEDLGHSYPMLSSWHHRLNCDVVAYDYSGYGLSGGKHSEKNAYGDADTVFDWVINTLEVPRQNIIIVGRSLGSGPATHLASTQRRLAGFVLISPLSTAARVVGKATSVFAYPIDIFPNKRKIHRVIDFPIHIFHGDQDEVVPFYHGKELYDIARGVNDHVTCSWLEGCGHNDIEFKKDKQFYDDFNEFLHHCAGYEYVAPTPFDDEESTPGCFGSSSSPRKKKSARRSP